LDNFEQIVEGATQVAAMQAACPRVKFLVTSREPLHLSGEQEFPVHPLPVPPPDGRLLASELVSYPSIALFVDCARRVVPDFALDDSNAAAVAGICARLDGLPLAIELAAARTKLLPPSAILEHLGKGLGLLSRPARDVSERQRTLEGAIAWSYDLLDEREKAVLRWLAVIATDATIEAIEAICIDVAAGAALEVVGSLVDKSLVHRRGPEAEPRFYLLQTVRDFALERLEPKVVLPEVARRHAAYLLSLVEQARPHLAGPDQLVWLERLDREHDNLRAALESCLRFGQASLALELAAGAWRFWERRGRLTEGRAMLQRALEAAQGDASARARALAGAGTLAARQGELETAEVHFREALDLDRRAGNPRGVARALLDLAWTIRERGDHERAASLIEDALDTYRRMGHERGVAAAMTQLALTVDRLGQQERAEGLLREVLKLHRDSGDGHGVAWTLAYLGFIQLNRGELVSAVGHLMEALALFDQTNDHASIGLAMPAVAAALIALGDPMSAVRLFGAASAVRERLATSIPPFLRADYDRAMTAARAALGDDAFHHAWSQGEATPVDEAVAFATSVAQRVRGPAGQLPRRTDPLTTREREVAALISEGLSNREIAARLHISQRTAEAHVQHILNKLGLHSRTQIAVRIVDSLRT
jgi:non-specific serine/threonine protein kinase